MADDKELFELSRRKALAGLGTIGAASAGAGLGTSAFFSDTETFSDNSLTAGELDMKVGYSSHYSDWKPNSEGVPEDEGVNVRMWDGAPNTTGSSTDLNSGETGLPTNDAWLIAVDDPETFLENTLQNEVGDASCDPGADAEELEPAAISIGDVKPGDFGEVTFDFALCDNPGFVWLQGRPTAAAENGNTEPEDGDDQETGADDESYDVESNDGTVADILDSNVELLDVVKAAYWVDDGNNYQNGDETPASVGSLRDILNELSSGLGGDSRRGGALLNGDIPAEEGGGMGVNCFDGEGEQHSVAFAWWVPIDHGNEIQGDSVEFDLAFYTEQCRHNDQRPRITTTEGGGYFVKSEENFNGDGSKSGGARARYGDSGGSGNTELVVGDDPGTGGDEAQYTWANDPGTNSVSWTVEYTASSDVLEFTWDGTTVSQALTDPQPDGRIGVQGKANEASVSVSNLSLNVDGTNVALSGPTGFTASNDDGNPTSGREFAYVVLDTALDGETDFTLSGDATVDIQSDYSGSNERLAFDVVLE